MSRRAHQKRRRAHELSCAEVEQPARRHRLEVSVHAVDRYIERVDPDASREQAEAQIRAAMDGARRKFRQGTDRWFYDASGTLGFQLVVREAPGRPRAVMTVVPAHTDGAAVDDATRDGDS